MQLQTEWTGKCIAVTQSQPRVGTYVVVHSEDGVRFSEKELLGGVIVGDAVDFVLQRTEQRLFHSVSPKASKR